MPTLSPEEQELIQRDRQEHPGCFYSTALSQSCRSINGDSKCEIIKKIFRQCPGERKEMISNRKEVTEDEHAGGDELTPGDFFNRERMDPRKGDGDFGSFFFNPFSQREDDFEAQMSPFDFFRQEMLRPFEGFFGGSIFGGGDSSLFEGIEREFERMPFEQQPSMPRRGATQPPPNPPHYSFQPSGKKSSGEHGSKARAEEQKDIFAGYSGSVDEV